MASWIEYEFELSRRVMLLLYSAATCRLSTWKALKLVICLIVLLFGLSCIELSIRVSEAFKGKDMKLKNQRNELEIPFPPKIFSQPGNA